MSVATTLEGTSMSTDDDHPVTIDIETATESTITAGDVDRLRDEAGLGDGDPAPRTIPADASSDVAYDDEDAGADTSGDHDIDKALDHRARDLQDQPAGVPEGAARDDDMPPGDD
jgi:hypothetical protein